MNLRPQFFLLFWTWDKLPEGEFGYVLPMHFLRIAASHMPNSNVRDTERQISRPTPEVRPDHWPLQVYNLEAKQSPFSLSSFSQSHPSNKFMPFFLEKWEGQKWYQSWQMEQILYRVKIQTLGEDENGSPCRGHPNIKSRPPRGLVDTPKLCLR